MINRKRIIDRFNMGMSIFSYYINFNRICNLHDINIEAESFVSDICRILYGWDLKNANTISFNNSGYDLISEKDKIIIQVTSTDKSAKLIHTLKTLETVMRKESDLSGYTLYFVILKPKADESSKYMGRENVGYVCPNGIVFNQKKNIYDFSTFIEKVRGLSEVADADKMGSLDAFMNNNRSLFGPFEPEVPIKNNIDACIKEYADNFCEKLFRHLYKDAEVTLERVFVQPEIYDSDVPSRKLVSILGNFLWNEKETRILFIEGDAACGKSSFISYLCYHYQQADEVGRGIFLQGNLICIRLRDLEIDEKEYTVEESIRDYLGFSNDNDYIENKIRFDNYVLILDGADELSMLDGYGRSSLEEILESIRRIFKRNKIIVTTHPQYIEYEKLRKSTFKFKVVRMQHFDRKMREEWITKYEKCGEKIPLKTKDYILNMDEKRAVGVADTPLALYLLVACEMRKELQENIWALYHEIFTNAIIETEYDENFNSSFKHPIRKNKLLLLEIVSRIAFEIFKKSEKEGYYIRAEELDSIVSEFDLEPSNAKWIRKCCVLCAYWKSNGTDGVLEFYHNNIRDYFLCEYIYNKINKSLMSDSEESVSAFLNSMCEIMSYGEIAGSTWEETFVFLHEKIRHEGEKSVHEREKMQIGKRLSSIFSNVLSEDIIWKYSYGGNNYQKMKYTVSNTLMLIRLWQDALGISMKDRKNTFAENRIDMENIVKSNILSDWDWIFQRSISIPSYNNRKVSIGQNCIFANISFEKKYLEREYLENSSFEKISFERSFFKDTVLKACRFTDGISFAGATLVGVDFFAAVLKNVDFTDATLSSCFFYGSTIINGNFNGCIIESCVFNETIMKDVDWSCAKAGGFDFDTVICENCCFDHINLKGYKVVESTFTECSFKEGNFADAFMECLHVQVGSFEKANFAGAMLRKNKWEKVNFAEADFNHATVSKSDIRQLESAGAVLLNINNKKSERC